MEEVPQPETSLTCSLEEEESLDIPEKKEKVADEKPVEIQGKDEEVACAVAEKAASLSSEDPEAMEDLMTTEDLVMTEDPVKTEDPVNTEDIVTTEDQVKTKDSVTLEEHDTKSNPDKVIAEGVSQTADSTLTEEKENELMSKPLDVSELFIADSISPPDSVQEETNALEVEEEDSQTRGDTSELVTNDTVFEEVDANVLTEKAALADESDMLGESDMTLPEKEDSVKVMDDRPSPMDVDHSSMEDVEIIPLEAEPTTSKTSKGKEPIAATEDKQNDPEVEEEDESQIEGEDVTEAMEHESVATMAGSEVPTESTAEGADVVDTVSETVVEQIREKSDNLTNEPLTSEKEHPEDADQPADKDITKIDTDSDETSKVGGKKVTAECKKESPMVVANAAPVNVAEEADTSTAREEDGDDDVENVQEPEESDVCLIPDTENEMTDAEKKRAIQARENAENEIDESAEDTATEKETNAPAVEETVQEPLLEEMQPSEPSAGAPHKTIIFLAVSAKHKCTQCDEQKVCGYRYKEADKSTTDYICEMACIDNLLAANPGKFFVRRKKFLVEEVPEDDEENHKCIQCKKENSHCKYLFKQDEETFFICSLDCYKALSTDEPEKFNLKRDSIRVRNIGHTTISSKGARNTDSRIVSRSAAEAEAARVERTASFLRRCTECLSEIQLRVNGKNLAWQTMDFCDELCLGKYQRRIGAQCQTCNGDVPHQSLGKYCVRFGFEVRQFCCAACLNNFKKGLKTCSCCQKDISASGEGFLAPVGDKEQFKDFCSQTCMRHYDAMCNGKKRLRTDRCAVCNFEKPMRVEMTIDGKEQNFCSNPCFSAFKFVSNIVPDQCGMCSKYFERKSSESFTIYGDKQRPKAFCSRICFNVFIIVNRQITSCQWCKVKKYDFDMIMKVVEQRAVMMCSLNCLTLYGVSINAFSRTAIECDNCNACTTPQYHLTMSDASMRNFCTYQCVMQFQSQFARIPLTLDAETVATATHHVNPKSQASKGSNASVPFPTGLPKRVKLNVNPQKNGAPTTQSLSISQPHTVNQVQSPVIPVISNVASLATGQTETMIGNTTVRRGGIRGRGRSRGRGQTYATESRPPRIPTPPPPTPTPAPAPPPKSTRTRSTTSSPILAAAPAPPVTVGKTRGRAFTRATATTSTEVAPPRPPSPVVERQVETKIITVPPYPPIVRNVQTSCRPKTEDISIDCKPETCEIGVQTDEDFSSKILIPVPVPIFVPQPMYMYSAPFPVPVPIPLPIPVPIFVPTTRNSSNGILKEIKKIQDKMPSDPFEAELLMMAEMVADEKNESDSDSEEDMKPEPRMIPVQYESRPTPPTNNVIVSMESQNNTSFGEDVLQMALKMASGEYEEPGVDLESAMTANTITHPPPGLAQDEHGMQMGHHMMMESQRGGRGRKRGALTSPITPRNNRSPIKRQRLSVDTPLQQPVQPAEKPDANMCLKFTFGVNAWKQWVMTKNADIEKSSVRRRLFKTELLQMTADELNYSLCLFVKEVRKPNGTEYAPDTIYYLVLGIQQFLYENGRIDNIFTDPYYERFTDCLDEVARKFSVLYNDSQYIVTRVEEEHLWECKQLGAHSPHVLLSTLMFFNTKHFNLTTVEEHMQLSFSHIMKHWKRSAQNAKSPGTRNVLLRFYPPQAGLDANPRKKKVYEQQENEENPLRCPVRLYEFYLSKCPESVKTRNDVFYLQPERSCVPDSPVWYSTQALSQEALQKMLHRVKMVKEINIALLTS